MSQKMALRAKAEIINRMPAVKKAALEVRDLHVHYGAVHALKGVSLTVQEGEIVTLIGANGAGKTTLLKTISGLLNPTQGVISMLGSTLPVGNPRASVK